MKKFFIKTLPLCLGVLVFTFALSYLVSAWTEPTQAPPGGNVDTPLNVGILGQTKTGGLMLNTGNATTGLIVATGTVGIGTMDPNYKLDINGDLNLQTSVLRLGGATGTAGQILASDGNKLYWVNLEDLIQQLDDICISSGACLSQINDFVRGQMLVGTAHSFGECTDASGTVVGIPTASGKMCQFTRPADQPQTSVGCPTGWQPYLTNGQQWTTTEVHSISGFPCSTGYGPSCDGCTTGFHSWANVSPEPCSYRCVCCRCGPDYYPTIYAYVVQIGCQ